MLLLLCVNLILPFCYWLVFFPISWLIFFIIFLVFANSFHFAVTGTCSFLCLSFRSSCRAGVVVTKSLNNCLSVKDFISPSLTKLCLAGYEILGWKFFSLRMLNIGPTLFWLIGFLMRDLLWVWLASLCGWPDLSLWLPLAFFPSFQSWWIWWLCALGCSSWGISLWCSLYFLDLSFGLPC